MVVPSSPSCSCEVSDPFGLRKLSMGLGLDRLLELGEAFDVLLAFKRDLDRSAAALLALAALTLAEQVAEIDLDVAIVVARVNDFADRRQVLRLQNMLVAIGDVSGIAGRDVQLDIAVVFVHPLIDEACRAVVLRIGECLERLVPLNRLEAVNPPAAGEKRDALRYGQKDFVDGASFVHAALSLVAMLREDVERRIGEVRHAVALAKTLQPGE